MTTEIRVPALGEAITEATVTTWFKRLGDAVAVDEPILELETDKVTLEVNAPTAGTLTEIAADVGIDVQVGALLGVVSSGDTALAASTVLAKENIPVTDFESTAEFNILKDIANQLSVGYFYKFESGDTSTANQAESVWVRFFQSKWQRPRFAVKGAEY